MKPTHTKFVLGDRVRKIKGSQWHGRIVGWYSTELTPQGYAVESDTEKGSVQIYPAAALEKDIPPQEFQLTQDDALFSLYSLKQRYKELGFQGACVVKFDPAMFHRVVDLPGFRHRDDYRYTEPIHRDEIGSVEMLHFAPEGGPMYRTGSEKDES